jgi:hypothetical protein
MAAATRSAASEVGLPFVATMMRFLIIPPELGAQERWLRERTISIGKKPTCREGTDYGSSG